MNIKCKAAIADGIGGFKIDTIEVGEPAADELLIKIKAAGICHTDFDSLQWKKSMILGHEGAGIVEAVGYEVQGFSKGDRVILNWATPCKHCFQCQEGNQHLCESNSPVIAGNNGATPGHAHLDGSIWNGHPVERSFNLGTLSEYTLVKASAAVKIGSDYNISFAAASIIGCGVMTGFGSVINAARVRAGSSVAVLGTGGVGLNVIQACRISGATTIIAVDINKKRLEMATRFGATDTILAEKDDSGLLVVSKRVKEMTNGRGSDYSFECTAVPSLGAAPLAMIRNGGPAVQVSGIEEEIKFDMQLFEWDKKYINPLYGQCKPDLDFPKILDLNKKGHLLLEEMISHKYSLNNLQQSFNDMLSGKNAKGVVEFE